MTQCEACSAPTDVFLCPRCVTTLRTTLEGVPRWIEALTDVVLRQTRIGASGKRGKGDAMPSLYAPDTTTVKGETRPTKQAQASTLLVAIRNDVITWHRHVCESRGITWVPRAFVGPLLVSQIREPLRPSIDGAAQWLADNVRAIACDEAAGECVTTFEAHARVAERIVDLPTPYRFVGPCQTTVTDRKTGRERECGTRLMATREATHVTCPACKTMHDVERVINRLLANVEHWRFSREELIGARNGDWTGIMGLLEEPVSKSAFHRWCKDAELKASGYRRPDGGIGLSRRSESDEPVYRLSRVRELRREMGARQLHGLRNRMAVG
jgi:hypothetical protein